jgi:hypothetical protein
MFESLSVMSVVQIRNSLVELVSLFENRPGDSEQSKSRTDLRTASVDDLEVQRMPANSAGISLVRTPTGGSPRWE